MRVTMRLRPYYRLAEWPDAAPSHETARRNPLGVQAAARALSGAAQGPGRAHAPRGEESAARAVAAS
jgi:hypothetical protein